MLPSHHYGFTGLDLGAGNTAVVSKVRFFPSGTPSRINGNNSEGHPRGCRFEGANVAPLIETVITRVEAGYGSGTNAVVTRSVNYNYTAQRDPVLASNWLDLTSVSYGDGTQANYTYQSLFDGQRPILALQSIRAWRATLPSAGTSFGPMAMCMGAFTRS